MKTKKLFFFFLMVMQVLAVSGKSKFYNSKSMIIGLTTNNNVFYSAGVESKVFKNEIPNFDFYLKLNGNKFDEAVTVRQMNEMQVGKQILDLLFERKKGKLSEDLLRKRAWENVQLADVERAAFGKYSPELILKEQILPILESNYILLIHEFGQKAKMTLGTHTGDQSEVAWIVLHADIDQSTWDEVIACWDNIKEYDKIHVNVSYVASGLAKEKSSLYTHNDHPYSALIRDISKKAPALAVRGQVLSHAPYKAALGTNHGIRPNWDLVRIFRQSVDANGEFQSKEIGKARILEATDEECQLRTVSGMEGSVEKGDMAVLMPIKRTGRSLMYQFGNGINALRYDFDIAVNLGGPTQLHVREIDLRAGFLKNGKYKDVNADMGDYIKNPMFASIGTGMGLGFLFLNRCEIEPYALLQAEGWTCSTKEDYSFDVQSDDGYKKSLTGFYLRLPVGLRLQVNVKYPLRIIGGVEYGLSLLKANKDMERCVFDPQGFKHDNLQFFVGLRWAY